DTDPADALDGGLQREPVEAVGGDAHLEPQPRVGVRATGRLGAAPRAGPCERRKRGARNGDSDEPPAGDRRRGIHDRLLSWRKIELGRCEPGSGGFRTLRTGLTWRSRGPLVLEAPAVAEPAPDA